MKNMLNALASGLALAAAGALPVAAQMTELGTPEGALSIVA